MQHTSDVIHGRSLLKRALKNDLDALKTIHDQFYPVVYKYVLYRLNDPVTAEDITSEVFTRLIETLQSPSKKPRDLRRWLFGVAHNIVVDYQRQHYRYQWSALNTEQPLIADDNTDPVSLLEGSMQIQALYSALNKLKPEQREVLALRFGAELSTKVTANIMHKSVNAVKVLQYRALSALKNILESWK